MQTETIFQHPVNKPQSCLPDFIASLSTETTLMLFHIYISAGKTTTALKYSVTAGQNLEVFPALTVDQFKGFKKYVFMGKRLLLQQPFIRNVQMEVI